MGERWDTPLPTTLNSSDPMRRHPTAAGGVDSNDVMWSPMAATQRSTQWQRGGTATATA